MAVGEVLDVDGRGGGVGEVKVSSWSRKADRVGESMKLSSSPAVAWRETCRDGGRGWALSKAVWYTIHNTRI